MAVSFSFQQSDPSKFQLILGLAKEMLLAANEIVNVGADWIVYTYFKIAAEWFDYSPTALASARIMFVCLIVGLVVWYLGELLEAWQKFKKPVETKPSLFASGRESSLSQLVAVIWYLLISIGIVWMSTHMMTRLLLPVELIFQLLDSGSLR